MSEAGAPLLRIAFQWLLGAALVVILVALFVGINGVQLTSRGTGERLLRRAVAVTTDVDALLPDLERDLQQAARDSGVATVRVPNFPIPVDFERDEAGGLKGDELRQRILEQAARRLYDDGMSAWAAADPESQRDIETISTAGILDRGLGLITEENHWRIVIATAVLGFLALVVAAALVMTVGPYARLAALSGVTLIAALPSLAAVVATRFAFRTAEEEADPFVEGLLDLGVSAMWLPIRNYLALSVLAFAVLAVSLALTWARARSSPPSPASP